MFLYSLSLLFVGLVSSENLHDQLTRGLCLCIEDNDVFARSDPGLDNPIVGVLKRDNCFVSNGGILHLKGITWYEVHTVNGERMWIDGFHLRAVNMSVCTNPSTTASPQTTHVGHISTSAPITTTTMFDPFASGTDFCFTDDGLVGAGQTYVQNGVLCKCTGGKIVCPNASG